MKAKEAIEKLNKLQADEVAKLFAVIKCEHVDFDDWSNNFELKDNLEKIIFKIAKYATMIKELEKVIED